jgi:hypothetical protein
LGERVPVGGGADGRGREGAAGVKELSKPTLPSVPQAIKALARLEADVERAETFIEIDAVSEKAAAWQRAFRPVQIEVANRAGLIWALAEKKLQLELAKIPRATGAAGLGKKGAKRAALMEPPIGVPTLAELGVSKKRYSPRREARGDHSREDQGDRGGAG